MNIKIKDIYRTNLSQPGGLVKVLKVEESWVGDKKPICYIEHVEDHPYGYPCGAKGYYYPENLVPVCQYCGEDLPEGETCEHCEMQRAAEDEVHSWQDMGYSYGMVRFPDDYDLGETYDYEYDDSPDTPDYDSHYEYIVSERNKRVITCNGQVWDVSLVVYTTGYRQCIRTQREDTCWDGMIPF